MEGRKALEWKKKEGYFGGVIFLCMCVWLLFLLFSPRLEHIGDQRCSNYNHAIFFHELCAPLATLSNVFSFLFIGEI